jgi:4-hydroxythreonine-4-phosphate dehydrogenase
VSAPPGEGGPGRRPPLLAVTMGDPAGIGPEVIVKAATVHDVRGEAELLVLGDPGVLERARDSLGAAVAIRVVESAAAARGCPVGELAVLPVSRLGAEAPAWGQPSLPGDRAQVEYIRRAVALVTAGEADAVVTAPISKASLSRAGAPWPGHTEMLAELTGTARPMMMLAGPTLKVVPLTTHIALKDVPAALNEALVLDAIRIIHQHLRRHFARRRPRIAVAGLNPHAGESGLFGVEERTVIAPAIAIAQSEGIAVQGPFAADTVFHRAVSGEFDVVLGMYHDQALIPLKLLDFDCAVNVTLGLPIVRTSVDHGTAYDIAGQGIASASSMIAALRLAAEMVRDGAEARARQESVSSLPAPAAPPGTGREAG